MYANTDVSIKTRNDLCKESSELNESRQNVDDLLVELDFVVSSGGSSTKQVVARE